MSPADQARAVLLLRRWRDLCLDGNKPSAQMEDDLEALTVLFIETDQFLNPGGDRTDVGKISFPKGGPQ